MFGQLVPLLVPREKKVGSTSKVAGPYGPEKQALSLVPGLSQNIFYKYVACVCTFNKIIILRTIK